MTRNSDSRTPWGAVTRKVSPSTRHASHDVISYSSGFRKQEMEIKQHLAKLTVEIKIIFISMMTLSTMM